MASRELSAAVISASAATSGVLAHLTVWIDGEWDAYSGQIVVGAILAFNALSLILSYLGDLDLSASLTTALFLTCLHLAGTFTSIVVYRIYFHRLRHFPGPLSAKIWIWDIVLRTWWSGHRQSMVVDKLHARYGPIVRYAPNRLSINCTEAIMLIHGSGSTSRCTKPVAYLNPANGGSVNADRDVASHHARRKIWERALSGIVLPTYILPLSHLTSTFITTLESIGAAPVSLNDYVQLFTFDALGVIGFGRPKGFEGLKTGALHPAIYELMSMMRLGVYMMLFPWLHVFLDYFPTLGIVHKPEELFRKFAKESLAQYWDVQGREQPEDEERKPATFKSDRKSSDDEYVFKDILSRIHPHPSLGDRSTLSDCVLLSIAGADTTTSSLIHTIYRLALHRHMQAKVLDEILATHPPARGRDAAWEGRFAAWIETAKLPYLEAFIREVLRLHTPAPTGLPRLTPPEGLSLPHPDGSVTLIPGDTNVAIPVYTLLRDPQNFAQPLDFLPERFLPASHPDAQPDLVRDSRAYIPFLQGPYGCAGKQLAYLEMKIVIAGLVNAFEMVLPRGTDVEDLQRRMDTQWRDFSTLKAADVEVCFVPRDRNNMAD